MLAAFDTSCDVIGNFTVGSLLKTQAGFFHKITVYYLLD
jgi:hypothetical protein